MKRSQSGRRLLNIRHERFTQLFVFGTPDWDPALPADQQEEGAIDTRSNATQSYIHAGYKARGASANVSASRLIHLPKIQVRINELRDEEQRIMGVYLRRWRTMLASAQEVLAKAMRGEEVSAQAMTAAREVIEQSEGPSRFRFGIQQGAGKDAGLSITLWSGRRND